MFFKCFFFTFLCLPYFVTAVRSGTQQIMNSVHIQTDKLILSKIK